eukprot:5106061-Pleurochrysis_carterae.AAC.1
MVFLHEQLVLRAEQSIRGLGVEHSKRKGKALLPAITFEAQRRRSLAKFHLMAIAPALGWPQLARADAPLECSVSLSPGRAASPLRCPCSQGGANRSSLTPICTQRPPKLRKNASPKLLLPRQSTSSVGSREPSSAKPV